MNDRRGLRWATTGVRFLAGAAVSVAAVAAVAVAVPLAWPSVVVAPVAVKATPAPQDTVLACNGSLLALGRDLADAGQIVSAADQRITAAVAPGGADPSQATIAGPNDVVEGPVVVTAPPVGRQRTDAAASGSSTASDEDLSGYAASACRPPLMQSWLVGGSASTGAADLVVLANPGRVAATVELTTYGADGVLAPAGGSNLVIPAGSQRVVPLAGLLLGEESPVVRVMATGAPVQASLQASITRTLTAGGVDQVGSIAAADTRQVIAGVAVTGAPSTGDDPTASTRVRILAPGADTSATVTVREVGSTDPAVEPSTVPLLADVPTEVELAGLSEGVYTITVDAGAPVVSAVWQTTGFGEGDDFAWYVPAPEITGSSMFAAPAGPRPLLVVANTGDVAATVTVTSVDGSTETRLEVDAGSSASVRLRSLTTYSLSDIGGGVHAALSLTRGNGLAGFPVWAADAASPAITVYP